MNKIVTSKLWKKLLCLDLFFAVFVIGIVSFRIIGEQKKETMEMQKNESKDDEEQMKTAKERKMVALTFDDGPHPVYTPMMLDVLKEKNVKATFFLLGEQVEKYPEIVKRMSEEGHLIGNHSYKHERLSKLSDVQACAQVNRTNELIYNITGKYPEYIRPPFGEWKKHLDCSTSMIEILWDLDTLDWSSQNKAKIVNKVVTNVEEDDIILMHDGYESTVSATKEIIDTLQKEGYEFVTVDELILE